MVTLLGLAIAAMPALLRAAGDTLKDPAVIKQVGYCLKDRNAVKNTIETAKSGIKEIANGDFDGLKKDGWEKF